MTQCAVPQVELVIAASDALASLLRLASSLELHPSPADLAPLYMQVALLWSWCSASNAACRLSHVWHVAIVKCSILDHVLPHAGVRRSGIRH